MDGSNAYLDPEQFLQYTADAKPFYVDLHPVVESVEPASFSLAGIVFRIGNLNC